MVTVLKDIPIPGIEVVACRLNGPRGIVKAFLLHDDRSLVAVDTGYNELDADVMKERIRSIGRDPKDLEMVFITHRHGDHVGGLKELSALGSFAVVSHGEEAAAIQENCGVKVDRVVDDGDEVPVVGGIRIIHMPGHTAGSIALYLERSRVLVVGDSILSAGEHLVVSPAYLCNSPEKAKKSVERLLSMELKIDTLLVAHGDDVYGDAGRPLGRIFVERRED